MTPASSESNVAFPEYSSDPKTLLEAANSASEKVSALHIAFLALLAYVLVIVFSTRDMDLLIGKGIKLPVVDVEVPITGFYTIVPYLVVLVHFNLLLQLQLLSRKLFAFDAAAPKGEITGGLHDQLQIFPYNYYLVGRPSRLIHRFVAMLVTTTILLLPLLALLTLQARFLAYQNVAITWAQRVAIWLDVVLVAMLWPVIMDRHDSWRSYMVTVWRRAVVRWKWWTWVILGIAMLLWSLETESLALHNQLRVFGTTLITWPLLTLLAVALRHGLRRLSKGRYFGPNRDIVGSILGMRGLLATLLLGLPVPLLLTVDGEGLDHPESLRATLVMAHLRHLDLHEQVLFAKPAKPEILADLRGIDQMRRLAALSVVERIDLQDRSLRHADLRNALIAKADLRGAKLQGAQLQGADLREAELREAELQGADLSPNVSIPTILHGAHLNGAQLQGADLREAELQGADLSPAVSAWTKSQDAIISEMILAGMDSAPTLHRPTMLQGADLQKAQLQGADLREAQLQGADLREAQMQGATLRKAQLQGADLREAELQAVDLREAQVIGSIFVSPPDIPGRKYALKRAAVVDLRGLQRDLSEEVRAELKKDALTWAWRSEGERDSFNQVLHGYGGWGPDLFQFDSCLDDMGFCYRRGTGIEEFRLLLLPELEKLACQSPYIANRILARYESDISREDSAMKGLASYLESKLKRGESKDTCQVLSSLHKETLHRLAEKDREPQAHRAPANR